LPSKTKDKRGANEQNVRKCFNPLSSYSLLSFALAAVELSIIEILKNQEAGISKGFQFGWGPV